MVVVVVQPKAHANCGEPVARPQTGVGTDGDGDGDGVTERRPVAERIGVRGGTGIDLWRPFSTASWRATWPTVSSGRERAPVIDLIAREGQCRRQRRRDELSPDRPEELSEDR